MYYLLRVMHCRGRNGFDGDARLEMRVEGHHLVKKVELNVTADQELALAA